MKERASFGNLSVTEDDTLLCNDQRMRLTAYEALVLGALIRARGRVVKYAELDDAAAAGGFRAGPRESNVLQVMVRRVRMRLESAGANAYIENVRGRGYGLALLGAEP